MKSLLRQILTASKIHKTRLSYRLSSRYSAKYFIMSSKLNDKLQLTEIGSKNAFVLTDDKTGSLKVSFAYPLNDTTMKNVNLLRQCDEELNSALERLAMNVDKFSNSSRKKAKMVVSGATDTSIQKTRVKVQLILNGSVLPGSTKNEDAWVDGAKLVVNNNEYVIVKNCPQVLDVKLPVLFIVGCPIFAKLSLHNCSKETCKFYWFRKISADESKKVYLNKENVIFYNNMHWLLNSEELYYKPVEQDLHHGLILLIIPSDGKREGPHYYTKTEQFVFPLEDGRHIDERHKLTSKLVNSNEFRVVSYNILADIYADSKYSRDYLFKHCPKQYLNIAYRRQLLAKEIEGYNGDIVCLQEVDSKEYEYTYTPYFEKIYHIFYAEKGKTSEGLLTMIDNNKFTVLNSHKTCLSELIDPDFIVPDIGSIPAGDKTTKTEQNVKKKQFDHFLLKERGKKDVELCFDAFNDSRKIINSNAELKLKFCSRKTVLQTTLIKSTDDKFYLIANTHLYFAPDADNIRMLQGYVCLKYMEFIIKYFETKLENVKNIVTIFCGDMNSTQDCGLYNILTKGSIPAGFKDWSSNQGEAVDGIELKTKITLESAYKNLQYTNYTPLFNGCLDYIYYQNEGLNLKSTVPMPDHELVVQTGGIPSAAFPSDHLALVADFQST